MNQAANEPFKFYRFLAPRHWPTWLALACLRITVFLPHSWQIKIGAFIGKLIYYLVKQRRRIAAINIQHCFPELSTDQQKNLVKACFRNLGISIIEAALSWWGKEQQLKPLFQIQGLHHLQDALQQNRPVLLISGHITCSDLAARMLSLHAPFQAMYKRANNQLFEAIMYRARSRNYQAMVERRETKKLIQGLKQLIPTWYAPDQNFPHEDIVFVPFFGVAAATLTATARLVKISNALVIPFFPTRSQDDKHYTIKLDKPLDNYPSGDTIKDAARINQLIESAVRQAPSQYMWVHKRFRTRPPGEDPIY